MVEPSQRVSEKVGARTEVSRTYKNSDGSETVEASPERVNFKAADGSWHPIDTRIVATGTKGVFTNAADSSTVQFAPISAGGVTVTLEDRSVFSFAPDVSGDVTPTASEDGSTVTYAEVWPGVDVRYQVLPVGVKEDIIVKDSDAAERVGSGSYKFRLTGAVAGADPAQKTAGLVAVGTDPADRTGVDQHRYRASEARRRQGRDRGVGGEWIDFGRCRGQGCRRHAGLSGVGRTRPGLVDGTA